MRFMAIVKATRDYEAGQPPKSELMAAMGKLAEEESKLGIFVTGGGLLPSSQGHKLRMTGGKVEMPLGKTFFSPRFGVLSDKFGVGWMVMVEQ